MDSENSAPKIPQNANRPARIYQLKPYGEAARSVAMNPGPGRSGAPAPPAPALIHLESNSGIELPDQDGEPEAKTRVAVAEPIETLPAHHLKKMFRIREVTEWMAKEYGVERIGMLTLTIRENVTDGKEFSRRFKSLSTNVFNRLFHDWLRVFERQKRGAWHVHVIVATKADIRQGTDVAALNELLKKKRDGKISQSEYYAGIQRLASPNLRGIWKEFRELCGLGKFKAKTKARRYKFDAAHLLPILTTAKALASYVSKYISKGFQHRLPGDKGLRLIGCSKRAAKVCTGRFSWADGAGRVWRNKLGDLAGILNFKSPDDFAKALGSRWAYRIRPAMDLLVLPHYATMKEARADGWDLVNKSDGSPWPWPDLDIPKTRVQASRVEAFKVIKALIQRRRGKGRRRSRVERGWDPERWENGPKQPRAYRIFKPLPKPQTLSQTEFAALDER